MSLGIRNKDCAFASSALIPGEVVLSKFADSFCVSESQMTHLSVILSLGTEANRLKVEGFLCYVEDPDLPPTPFSSTNQPNKMLKNCL